ncbi:MULTISPECIES: tetratricopeptide repeat protein [Legionella]|uniref:Sel-1 protein n=2 Tax=Legionella TaxID=445 RepID=A0A378KY77_9GAMM|nr:MULTISPECIES: SEL1-like repeat protein [Legionella]KTD52604.1 Sel-1 protein [Legionella quateirensis]MBL7479869.1 sel1 repeat family protein [Legionella bononiensis]MBL7525616.1 sel1 repeat family protein [Legionella bononiensis]MBL7561799.1 sel1 repeat family protein [Legionella bononiensis]STY18467.1 Sel-1 protein [Legionella quateirensis]
MRSISRLLLILIFIPLLAACISSAYNLHEGIQSFKAQDYRRAFIRLKPEAAKGQPDAQYAIGYMYYYGQGVVEDRKKAWYWINMAAEAGQPDAVVATKILERGSLEKKKIFQSKKLQNYPVEKILF